jgi:hypothetical protein
MSARLERRRRMIRTRGRLVQLQRQARGSTSIEHQADLLGFPHAPGAADFTAGVQQGDLVVETLDDELQAYGWPDQPRSRDKLLLDGLTYTVANAFPIFDAALRIGWRIWVKGGA